MVLAKWLFIIFILGPTGVWAAPPYLFQSVSNVNGYKTLPAKDMAKNQLILTVAPNCSECLTQNLKIAEQINRNTDLKIEAAVVLFWNWQKAKEFLAQKRISLSEAQQKIVFVDPGSRFKKDHQLENKSYIYLTGQGQTLRKGDLPLGTSTTELLRTLNIRKPIK